MIKKTYITKMPDKAGTFLKASDVISKNGGNIVRVNYNKAVDMHTLFIEVSADSKETISKITDKLTKLGYLPEEDEFNRVILIVLKLLDKPGTVTPILQILNNYDINISYMSSQQNGTEYQYFKMGLLIENPKIIKAVIDEIAEICDVKILDYDITEKVLDSTVFYISFANEMRNLLSLSQHDTNKFIIYSNRIMQMLDEKNETPFKTFEYIRKFAKFVVDHSGDKFNANISQKIINSHITLYCIEPPCGSNTYILKNNNKLLFIDSGFACFRKEMFNVFYTLFPDFDNMDKDLLLTHADIDHAGISDIFNNIYMNENCYQNFVAEHENRPNFREQNQSHASYCKLSRIISGYSTPPLDKIKVISKKTNDSLLSETGTFNFADLEFIIYEGDGGHVKGEAVYICPEAKIAFTGDCIVNIKGFSKEQYEFNLLAPYLMTSVNIDSKKATAIRKKLTGMLSGYLVCPGHGSFYYQD